jgi:hypothetical protein
MPTYTVIDTKKDKEYEVICSWDELQHIISSSPDLKQGLATPMSVSMTGNTVSKTSGDWRDYTEKSKKRIRQGQLS